MMKKSLNTFDFKVFVCFAIFILISHSFGITNVQADEGDNRSVADGYNSSDGQAPSDEENPTEELLVDDQPTQGSTDDILEDQSLFSMFFQLFLALAVIIIMIYVLIRFIGKRSQSYQTHRTLQNIGGVHVGANRSIQLVRVGERVLVVGVGESIQLLKEIDDEVEIKRILEDYEMQEGQPQLSSLYKWMQSKFTHQNVKQENSNVHFKKLLERQLTDVKQSQQKAHATIKENEQQ